MGRDEAKLAKVTTRSLKALQLYSQAEPRVLYAGTYLGGVFKSGNAGGSWTPMNTGLTSSYVPVLAIYLSAPTTLYAATSSGVFKSVNGDGSWTAVNTRACSIRMFLPWQLILRRRPRSTRARACFQELGWRWKLGRDERRPHQ